VNKQGRSWQEPAAVSGVISTPVRPRAYLLTKASPDGCPECRGLHRPWADEETEKALDLRAAGRTNAKIAEVQDRTKDNVKEKLRYIHALSLENSN
jgi:hypothetical protein